MARKRRTKAAAKRNTRTKSDSDQNSNEVSDEQERETTQDESTTETSVNNVSQTSVVSDASQAASGTEINHKRFGKFRCLERRHSSSQEDECEISTSDLAPQDIHNIVIGNVKDVIINHTNVDDDIADDTCFQGNVEHEEVIVDTIECDPFAFPQCSVVVDPIRLNERLGFNLVEADESRVELPSSSCSSELVNSFERSVHVSEKVDSPANVIIPVEPILILSPSAKGESEVIIIKDSSSDSGNTLSSVLSSPASVPDIPILPVPMLVESSNDSKKSDEETKTSEEPRRRSSRIRINRWNEDEAAKTLQIQETYSPQSTGSGGTGPPSGLFDPDKPVKVKSRWRRTSELEMGGGAPMEGGEGLQGPPPAPSPPPPLTPPPMDPEVEERLKGFQIIPHNVFLRPRVKSKENRRMLCDCTLTKEEQTRGDTGCGDDCLNRLLMIECGSRCSLGNLCSNKRFQNCEYAQCQVIKTEKKGLGLIALTTIATGDFLMEYVGEVLDPKEFRRRAKEYSKEKSAHFYFMALKSDTIIDATGKGNISRFINHSCNPNAETQKWTVNGELRIGFFSKRPIMRGEEITFDYQLQRYGKEAQKCYCGAENCRGWIGEDPEKEKDREKKEWSGKKERKEKKRKEEKRRDSRDLLSDIDLEEEVEKLSTSGVKNQKHTLTLSRLMVRAEDDSSRKQLLRIAQAADTRCLRLFLDYHALGLLWSWMIDARARPKLKLEILNTLAALPITNKTILKDSKVLNVVVKWAKQVTDDSTDAKDGNETEETSPVNGDSMDKPEDKPGEKTPEDKLSDDKEDGGEGEDTEGAVVGKAGELLTAWSDLKEEFRIPKKERIEQMKEHEREADRGYYSDPREAQSYDRHWNQSGRLTSSRERKRGRGESPELDWRKSRYYDERYNGAYSRMTKAERRQLFALKVEEEERQRKLEEEWAVEEERQRQLEEEWAAAQEAAAQAAAAQHCGGPPNFFQPPPPNFPCPPDGEIMYGGCPPPGFPPPYMGPPQQGPPPPYLDPQVPYGPQGMEPQPPYGPQGIEPQPPYQGMEPQPPYKGMEPQPPYGPQGMDPQPPYQGMEPQPPYPGPPGVPFQHPQFPPLAPQYRPPLPPYPNYPPFNPPPNQMYPPGPIAPPLPNGPPPPHLSGGPIPGPCRPGPPILQGAPLPGTPVAVVPLPNPSVPPTVLPASVLTAAPPPPPPPPSFPIRLPPKWKSAKDKEGRIYYYHTKTRKSQWQIPTEESTYNQTVSDSESDSEDSSDEDDTSSDEEDEEKDEEEEEEEAELSMLTEAEEEVVLPAAAASVAPVVAVAKEEEEGMETGGERVAVEVVRPVEEIPMPSSSPPAQQPVLKKRREGLVQVNIISPRDGEDDYRCGIKKREIRATKEKLAKEKKKKRSGGSGAKKCEADTSGGPRRRIKDLFRIQMAHVMVGLLNPYRKPDCKAGRITNTEDFKHLARKLTHFVMVKELKHCSSVSDLECNDNVKHKAKDFIRKYMSKFGPIYKRSPDD